MKTVNRRLSTAKKIIPVPNFESGILAEPLISFGGGHTHVDPKVGLGLYGPYSNAVHDRPTLRNINIGIVGPGGMIADAMSWIKACQGVLSNDGSQPFLYPHFPGIHTNAPFQCELEFGDAWSETIRERELQKAVLIPDFFDRIDKIIELYIQGITVLSQREPKPNVILCCIPQEVIDVCTVRTDKTGETKRIKITPAEKQHKRIVANAEKQKQMFLFDDSQFGPGVEEEEDKVHHNLRRGLKAEAMRFGIATQIVWPRTLSLVLSKSTKAELKSQDIATKAWNFVTALYYKAGGSPWRLHQVDPGVCFVGISFFRDIHATNPKMRTSMAQTFTAAGDGYVLRGNSFIWDDSKSKAPHLDKNNAAALIQNVLDLYRAQNRGQLPSRLVVHKTSKFWNEELEGFETAASIVPNKDFVAFGKRGIQFYRQGDYPPLRGTFVKFASDNLLLYTVGYTSYLKSYNGPRVPMPLEIVQHIGDSPWNVVLKEILALTKMNWNTADFACSYPITIAFSQKVGQILAELPEDYPAVRPEYRFYM